MFLLTLYISSCLSTSGKALKYGQFRKTPSRDNSRFPRVSAIIKTVAGEIFMIHLTDEQIDTLNREALVVIVSSLQSEVDSFKSQLESANEKLYSARNPRVT